MTNQFATPFQNVIGSGFDYLTAGTQPSEIGVAPAEKNTCRVYDDAKWPANVRARLGRFEITLRDFSQQGANHPEGDFSSNSNGYSWSTLITSQRNELLGALKTVSFTTAALSANAIGVHSAYAFSTLFFGIGSGANAALWKEGGANSFTAITHSPAGDITSLTNVLAAGAERLAVGYVGAPVKLMSDNTGTVATTMDTSTNSCWGIINSGINASSSSGAPTMLMYCGTTLGTKASDATLTTAITVTKTGLNAGGKAIGAIKPKGRSQRAFWLFPKVSNTAGALKYGAEKMMDIWSSDMTADDLLPLWPIGKPSNYCPNGVINAEPYREGIIYWDATHLVYWDGETEFDLGLLDRRPTTSVNPNQLTSHVKRRIRSVVVDGPYMYCVWEDYFFNGLTAGHIYLDVYNFEAGSWHNFAKPITLTTVSGVIDPATVLAGSGGIMVSPSTRLAYIRNALDGTWWSFYIPRASESLLWQNSSGSGSDHTGLPLYVTGELLSTNWWLDEMLPSSINGTDTIRMKPKVITEAEFRGNLDYGDSGVYSSDWTLRLRVQGKGNTAQMTAYDQTFSFGQNQKDYVRRNPLTAMANIYNLQVYLTATNSAESTATAQFLPLVIRGVYSKDGSDITENDGRFL
jgi:hypothetical protein